MNRALLILCCAIAACSAPEAAAPHAGTLTLSLSGGSPTDGALVIIVSGAPVTSVTPAAGYQVASNADGQGTHIMVLGPIATGPIATISVPNADRASAYVATVQQVSDRTTYALLDPAAYHIVIAP
jgi:hypothetical protein